jgi:hypothetical protein
LRTPRKENEFLDEILEHDFDDLWEWGKELLPPLRIYNRNKYFYKGITNQGHTNSIRYKIVEFIDAMDKEGRFNQEELDSENYLQRLVKKFYYREWLVNGWYKLPLEKAEHVWIKYCIKLKDKQDNYLQNLNAILKRTKKRWKGKGLSTVIQDQAHTTKTYTPAEE